MLKTANWSGGQGRGLHGDAVDLSDLVLAVANWSDRPVVDRTGIEARASHPVPNL